MKTCGAIAGGGEQVLQAPPRVPSRHKGPRGKTAALLLPVPTTCLSGICGFGTRTVLCFGHNPERSPGLPKVCCPLPQIRTAMLRGGKDINLEAGQMVTVVAVGDDYDKWEGYKDEATGETKIGISYAKLCQ